MKYSNLFVRSSKFLQTNKSKKREVPKTCFETILSSHLASKVKLIGHCPFLSSGRLDLCFKLNDTSKTVKNIWHVFECDALDDLTFLLVFSLNRSWKHILFSTPHSFCASPINRPTHFSGAHNSRANCNTTRAKFCSHQKAIYTSFS